MFCDNCIYCIADLCCWLVISWVKHLQFNWLECAGYQRKRVVDNLCEVTIDTQSSFKLNIILYIIYNLTH